MNASTRVTRTKTSSLSLRCWLAFAVLMFAQVSVAVTASLAGDQAAAAAAATARAQSVLAPTQIVAGKQQRGQAVIDAVPMEARADFILYQLARAINNGGSNFSTNNSDNDNGDRWAINPRFFTPNPFIGAPPVPTFEAIPVYTDFVSDLLHWLAEQYRTTPTILARSKKPLPEHRDLLLCTPKGVCFSKADIGATCCPF